MQRLAIRLWRHRLIPLIVLVSASLLMVLSLTHQFAEWRAILTVEPLLAPTELTSDSAAVDLKQVAQLFEPVATETDVAPRNTDLPLTLLGSFVHGRGEQSAALVQVSGKAPQRLVPGEEVIQGVHLQAVHPDHVVLVRGGESERLFFPRAMALHSPPAGAGQGTAHRPFQAAQLKKLPGVAPSESQKKIKALVRGITPAEGTILDQR